MPLSTPETVDRIVMKTASAMIAIWMPIEVGMPNIEDRPKFRKTTPMPSDTEMPKIVPIVAAISTEWPMGPWIRLPKIGARADRMLSGRW